MIGIAWAILTSRLAGPIASAVALALAVMLGVQTVKLMGAEHGRKGAVAERDMARVDLGTCRGNVSTLQDALGVQNRAVQAIKAESDARTAAANKALSEARKSALAARKSADAILAARVKPGETSCEAADRVILEAVG